MNTYDTESHGCDRIGCDKMYVPSNVLCCERPTLHHRNKDTNLLYLLTQHAPPGYALLQTHNASCTFFFDSCCFAERLPGQFFLSSEYWRQLSRKITQAYIRKRSRFSLTKLDHGEHGPSITSLTHNFYSTDEVYALACECPTYMNNWLQRKRSFDWPSSEVRRDVSNLNAHVVPVGNTNSSYKFCEWRICFTQGEVRLVKSLNDCLTKVTVLLKEITTATLKPVCKEMTSYVMKNIVFWIAELHICSYFTECTLIQTLFLALQFLKLCLITNKLPSYMIPERNLFADRVTALQRHKLCERINSMFKQGPSIILKCSKIRNALTLLHRSPDEFCEDSTRRQRIEIMCLLLLVHCGRYINPYTDYIGIAMAIGSDDVALKFSRGIINTIPEEHRQGLEWMNADIGQLNAEHVKKVVAFLNLAGKLRFKNIPYLHYLNG